MALNIVRDAAAVVRDGDLHLIAAEAAGRDQHPSGGPIGKAVSDGIEDEIGQDLTVG